MAVDNEDINEIINKSILMKKKIIFSTIIFLNKML